MKIKITNLSGVIIEIDVEENITIKELKEAYVNKKNTKKKGETEYTEEEKAALAKEIFEAEFNLQLVLDTEILDDNRKLNEVFKGDKLKGEITITAIPRHLNYAECLRDIKKLHSTSSQIQTVTKIKGILERVIDSQYGTPIFASSDKEIVFAAMQEDALAFAYASEELKSNTEFMLAAMQRHELAHMYAPETLKTGQQPRNSKVHQNGLAPREASEELKADKEYMLKAVKKNGKALYLASPLLKADRTIVLAAVQQHGETLFFASPY
jgi:hypothetical protein